jgi:hypothetical protein
MITATHIHDRLVEQAANGQITLQDGLTESDVQSWYDGLDIQTRKQTVDDNLPREVITDIQRETTISGQSLSVADVIESRGDDPTDFDCAYLLRGGRTFVQYFRPRVGGKQAMDKPTAESEMADHADRIVTQQVSGQLLSEAIVQFTV